VQAGFAGYRLDLAASALYEFNGTISGDPGSGTVEKRCCRSDGRSEAEKRAREWTLSTTLRRCCARCIRSRRFITDEIWIAFAIMPAPPARTVMRGPTLQQRILAPESGG